MIQGLYAAATGMMAIEDRQAVIANNIANVSTPGFKRQDALFKGFHQVFLRELSNPFRLNFFRGPGGGVKVVETFTDMGNGVIASTNDPLNVALVGPGFMAVDTPEGERFTRNGKLAVAPDGQLTTVDGHTLQSMRGGPIIVGAGRLEVDSEGTVQVAGESVGQIRLIEFEEPRLLRREGSSLYLAPPEALRRSAAAADTQIVSRALEMSNVQVPRELANLTVALRAYVANQRVITAMDDSMRRVIEQVGSPV